MKKTIIKVFAIALFGAISFSTYADVCRDKKLDCKEGMKSDGDYTSLERSICRDIKLECKDTIDEV